MHQIIPSTTAQGSVILRDSTSETFRPAAFCATRKDLEGSLLKIRMERLEIEAALASKLSPIACAAHFSKVSAEENAANELNERLSVAAWWAYRRGGILQSPGVASHVLNKLHLNGKPKVTLGEIPSVTADQSVWVSVIETPSYPYAVLGTASNKDQEAAALHAYHESLLSHGASVWLRATEPKNAPRWDFGELHARTLADGSNLAVGAAHDTNELMHNIQARPTILTLGEVSVALITSTLFVGYSTNNLASLVRLPDEEPLVRTEANL